MIRVCGPKDKPKDPNAIILNVTSTSKDPITKAFSPFFMGPVKLYGPFGAWNMENAWQYCKVYKNHCEWESEDPTDDYWDWAMDGWAKQEADRYPMGKGAKPFYSLWDGERLDYIEARKHIYVPLYKAAIPKTEFGQLLAIVKSLVLQKKTVYLFDFDGYDHVALNMTLDDVLNNEERKMGHAFVLAAVLEENL